MRALFFALLGIASTTHAQTLGQPMGCGGPGWSLSATETGATFDFQRITEMRQMLETRTEEVDWPRAYTFIGRGDSAILILEDRACETDTASGPYTARVLTQRGDTPVLLTGCCLFLQG